MADCVFGRERYKVTHDPRFFPTCGAAAAGRWIHFIHQSSQQAFRAWLEGIAPWLWTSVVKIILDQPVFAVMGVLGILLMLLFRPRKPLIGYSRN